jgi:hypothetical protein
MDRENLLGVATILSFIGFVLILSKAFLGFAGLSPVILVVAAATSACYFLSLPLSGSSKFSGVIWALIVVLEIVQLAL